MAGCMAAFTNPGYGREYHVCGKTGDNANDGSSGHPFKDPSYATSKLVAGDTLVIRAGRYDDIIGPWQSDGGRRRSTANVGQWQDPEKPVVIRAAEGETVVFDGTVAIKDISEGGWERHGSKGIWKIRLKQDIWELFDDGEIQTSARWPNAFWHDGSIWNQNNWASFGDQTFLKNREYIDADTKPLKHCDIAKAGFDATGAMIVLNIANFDNYCEVVTEHGEGQPRFKTTFNKTGTVNHLPIMRGNDRADGTMTRQFKKGEGRLLPLFNLFFLECSLALVDAPTEWFYDKNTRILYYYPMDGRSPEGRDVRGKIRDYAFDIMGARGVVLKGLDFFGTTVSFKGVGRDGDCSHITIEDCNFRYPSYNKRMLGVQEPGAVTSLSWNQGRSLTDWWKDRYYTVRNCTFYRSDGVGIWMAGNKNRIENCLFKEIDYSVIDPASGRKGGKQMTFRGNDDTLQIHQSPDIQVHRVTVDTAGSAHSIPTGANIKGNHHGRGNRNTDFSTVSYCRVVRGGLMQVQDGANFHIWQFESDYGTFDHCWASETTKWGFRFDGTYVVDPNAFDFNSRLDHCRVSYCVAWDTWQDNVFTGKGHVRYGSGNFIIKGDYHSVYNNLSFDGDTTEIYIRSEDGGNKNSEIRNNLARNITGKVRSAAPEPFNGTQGSNLGDREVVDIRSILRDPDNLDFRPKAGSPVIDQGQVIEGVTVDVVGSAPDIGPYEFGSKTYWIPGYQAPGASVPIPPDGTRNAKPDLDLMWQPGYQAESHTVYAGTNRNSLRKLGTFTGAENICTLGTKLSSGRTYYWRVDTVDRFGKKLVGKVWSFQVGERAEKPKS